MYGFWSSLPAIRHDSPVRPPNNTCCVIGQYVFYPFENEFMSSISTVYTRDPLIVPLVAYVHAISSEDVELFSVYGYHRALTWSRWSQTFETKRNLKCNRWNFRGVFNTHTPGCTLATQNYHTSESISRFSINTFQSITGFISSINCGFSCL